MMKKLVMIMSILSFCLLNTSDANARLQSTISPLSQIAPFKLGVNSLSTAAFEDKSISHVDFTVNEIAAAGLFSTVDISAGKLFFGANFRYTQYIFNSDMAEDNDLYDFSLPVTYITGSESWTHITRIAPGIHSDFEEIDSEDFTVTAFYQATYKSSDTLSWVMGAGIGHAFGELKAFPLMGAIYKPSDKLLFNLVLPQLKMIYSAQENWIWHLSLAPAGRSWNVEDKTKKEDVNIVTTEFRLSAGSTFAITDTIAIRGTIGSAMNRNIEFSLNNGEEVDLDVEDSSFVSIALEMRL